MRLHGSEDPPGDPADRSVDAHRLQRAVDVHDDEHAGDHQERHTHRHRQWRCEIVTPATPQQDLTGDDECGGHCENAEDPLVGAAPKLHSQQSGRELARHVAGRQCREGQHHAQTREDERQRVEQGGPRLRDRDAEVGRVRSRSVPFDEERQGRPADGTSDRDESLILFERGAEVAEQASNVAHGGSPGAGWHGFLRSSPAMFRRDSPKRVRPGGNGGSVVAGTPNERGPQRTTTEVVPTIRTTTNRNGRERPRVSER